MCLIVSLVAEYRGSRKNNDVHGAGRKQNSLFTLSLVCEIAKLPFMFLVVSMAAIK